MPLAVLLSAQRVCAALFLHFPPTDALAHGHSLLLTGASLRTTAAPLRGSRSNGDRPGGRRGQHGGGPVPPVARRECAAQATGARPAGQSEAVRATVVIGRGMRVRLGPPTSACTPPPTVQHVHQDGDD